jgi:hypothetical protein
MAAYQKERLGKESSKLASKIIERIKNLPGILTAQ